MINIGSNAKCNMFVNKGKYIVLRLITLKSFLTALKNNFDDGLTNKKRKETLSFYICHDIGSLRAI